MTIPADKHVVDQAYYFDAAPERVFRALVDPKQLVMWFLREARINPRKGSSYTFTWEGGFSHTGRVEKVEPDRMLVLTWPDTIREKVYETKVAFTLTKKGKGTLLRLKHTGFNEGDDWVWLYGAIESGWAYFLTNLKSVLAHGFDLRSKYDDP